MKLTYIPEPIPSIRADGELRLELTNTETATAPVWQNEGSIRTGRLTLLHTSADGKPIYPAEPIDPPKGYHRALSAALAVPGVAVTL